jgi:hypothetical protein
MRHNLNVLLVAEGRVQLCYLLDEFHRIYQRRRHCDPTRCDLLIVKNIIEEFDHEQRAIQAVRDELFVILCRSTAATPVLMHASLQELKRSCCYIRGIAQLVAQL